MRSGETTLPHNRLNRKTHDARSESQEELEHVAQGLDTKEILLEKKNEEGKEMHLTTVRISGTY